MTITESYWKHLKLGALQHQFVRTVKWFLYSQVAAPPLTPRGIRSNVGGTNKRTAR